MSIVHGLDVVCNIQKTEFDEPDERHCYINETIILPHNESLNFIAYGDKSEIKLIEFLVGTHSNITSIPEGLFQDFSNLETLILNGNVEHVSSADLQFAENLEFLTLNNRLTELPDDLFVNTRKLNSINFDNNQIYYIADWIFKDLDKLQYIQFSNNKLTIIHRHTFSGLTNLNSLDLTNNEINRIVKDALNLPNLQYLYLGGNKLKRLSSSMFWGLPQLLQITLYNNELTHIVDAFYVFESKDLTLIDLSNNKIEDIDMRSFARITSLLSLNLENSGFKFENETCSSKYEGTYCKLQTLNIASNNLSKDPRLHQLSLFYYLETLDISNNNITTFDLGGDQIKSVFPNLRTIRMV